MFLFIVFYRSYGTSISSVYLRGQVIVLDVSYVFVYCFLSDIWYIHFISLLAGSSFSFGCFICFCLLFFIGHMVHPFHQFTCGVKFQFWMFHMFLFIVFYRSYGTSISSVYLRGQVLVLDVSYVFVYCFLGYIYLIFVFDIDMCVYCFVYWCLFSSFSNWCSNFLRSVCLRQFILAS